MILEGVAHDSGHRTTDRACRRSEPVRSLRRRVVRRADRGPERAISGAARADRTPETPRGRSGYHRGRPVGRCGAAAVSAFGLQELPGELLDRASMGPARHMAGHALRASDHHGRDGGYSRHRSMDRAAAPGGPLCVLFERDNRETRHAARLRSRYGLVTPRHRESLRLGLRRSTGPGPADDGDRPDRLCAQEHRYRQGPASITGDRIVVDYRPCACGNRGPSIADSIVRYADMAGDDKIACAGTADAYVRGLA